jgi:tetratricopeptide (TPR) repeat protein
VRWLPAACLLASSVARAAEADPDTEIARRHYNAGTTLYDAEKYEDAVREFRAAQVAHPSPALDFNVGRCLDRLERVGEAVAAYERYLQGAPDAKDAGEVRARVEALRARQQASTPKSVQIPVVTVTVGPSARRSLTPPAILAAGTLALAVTGAALLGTARADYGRLEASCAPTCDRGSWNGVQAMERAGWALVGIAGAAAVVDVVLWVRTRRRR